MGKIEILEQEVHEEERLHFSTAALEAVRVLVVLQEPWVRQFLVLEADAEAGARKQLTNKSNDQFLSWVPLLEEKVRALLLEVEGEEWALMGYRVMEWKRRSSGTSLEPIDVREDLRR